MKKIKILLSALLLTLAVAAPSFATTSSGAADQKHPGVCGTFNLNVSLAPGQPANQYVSSTFCYPFRPDVQNAVDVLVHGATYDHTYWDSAYSYPDYSYVYRTLNAGRAVFYYDRLGVGKSSRLDSTSVTMDADAEVVHQIIQHLKPAFHKVDLIGHSYGSRISLLETSKYNDATNLVLTDSLHAAGPAIVNGVLLQYPANQDPQFANMVPALDNGWSTSVPGARSPFYYLPGADPKEIAYDEAHKAILSNTEFVQGRAIQGVPAGSNVSNKINRPILLILGQQDALYCGLALDCSNTNNILNNEKPYYTSAASLTAITVPNTGHDLALHLSANKSFDKINDWIVTRH